MKRRTNPTQNKTEIKAGELTQRSRRYTQKKEQDKVSQSIQKKSTRNETASLQSKQGKQKNRRKRQRKESKPQDVVEPIQQQVSFGLEKQKNQSEDQPNKNGNIKSKSKQNTVKEEETKRIRTEVDKYNYAFGLKYNPQETLGQNQRKFCLKFLQLFNNKALQCFEKDPPVVEGSIPFTERLKFIEEKVQKGRFNQIAEFHIALLRFIISLSSHSRVNSSFSRNLSKIYDQLIAQAFEDPKGFVNAQYFGIEGRPVLGTNQKVNKKRRGSSIQILPKKVEMLQPQSSEDQRSRQKKRTPEFGIKRKNSIDIKKQEQIDCFADDQEFYGISSEKSKSQRDINQSRLSNQSFKPSNDVPGLKRVQNQGLDNRPPILKNIAVKAKKQSVTILQYPNKQEMLKKPIVLNLRKDGRSVNESMANTSQTSSKSHPVLNPKLVQMAMKESSDQQSLLLAHIEK